MMDGGHGAPPELREQERERGGGFYHLLVFVLVVLRVAFVKWVVVVCAPNNTLRAPCFGRRSIRGRSPPLEARPGAHAQTASGPPMRCRRASAPPQLEHTTASFLSRGSDVRATTKRVVPGGGRGMHTPSPEPRVEVVPPPCPLPCFPASSNAWITTPNKPINCTHHQQQQRHPCVVVFCFQVHPHPNQSINQSTHHPPTSPSPTSSAALRLLCREIASEYPESRSAGLSSRRRDPVSSFLCRVAASTQVLLSFSFRWGQNHHRSFI